MRATIAAAHFIIEINLYLNTRPRMVEIKGRV
jgi:hypothetical protein